MPPYQIPTFPTAAQILWATGNINNVAGSFGLSEIENDISNNINTNIAYLEWVRYNGILLACEVDSSISDLDKSLHFKALCLICYWAYSKYSLAFAPPKDCDCECEEKLKAKIAQMERLICATIPDKCVKDKVYKYLSNKGCEPIAISLLGVSTVIGTEATHYKENSTSESGCGCS